MAGENFDFSSDPDPQAAQSPPAVGKQARKFLGIHFACCDVYTRVYINREGAAYEGNCPKCANRIRLRIGPDGNDARFYTAY